MPVSGFFFFLCFSHCCGVSCCPCYKPFGVIWDLIGGKGVGRENWCDKVTMAISLWTFHPGFLRTHHFKWPELYLAAGTTAKKIPLLNSRRLFSHHVRSRKPAINKLECAFFFFLVKAACLLCHCPHMASPPACGKLKAAHTLWSVSLLGHRSCGTRVLPSDFLYP